MPAYPPRSTACPRRAPRSRSRSVASSGMLLGHAEWPAPPAHDRILRRSGPFEGRARGTAGSPPCQGSAGVISRRDRPNMGSENVSSSVRPGPSASRVGVARRPRRALSWRRASSAGDGSCGRPRRCHSAWAFEWSPSSRKWHTVTGPGNGNAVSARETRADPPEAVDLVALVADVAAPARGLDLGRDQVPREEPQLDHRPETRSGDRVVDLVDERPVVDRRPVGRFLVDVRRAASRLGQAVAAGQRVVITNVIRDLGQLAERPVERLAARRVGPVDLVVADAGPDAAERSPPVLAVDPNARVHGVRRKRIVLYSRCRADPRGEMSAARSPSGARRVRTATPAVDRRRGCEGRPPDGWTAMPPTS
jgi:hypothetical protein